jgi:hypothetical protein
MEEKNISPEERLKQINAERKELKAIVLDSREKRLAEAAKMRVVRDANIKKINEKLKLISTAIYTYNKLGKVSKMKCDILNTITNLIASE